MSNIRRIECDARWLDVMLTAVIAAEGGTDEARYISKADLSVARRIIEQAQAVEDPPDGIPEVMAAIRELYGMIEGGVCRLQ